MIGFIIVAGLIILLRFFLKDWRRSSITPANEKKKINLLGDAGIIGKSTFVLDTDRNKQIHPDSSGKMDIEVPLDYEENELDEELEELGVTNESLVDITFEEMIEVVTEVEKEQPEKPTQTGRLLYENENTGWVEQLAATSEIYQKRISCLIDLHLGMLGQNDIPVSDDGVGGFDIGEYVKN